MSDKTPNQSINFKVSSAKLYELCAKNPNDPVLRVRLAESYQKTGNVIRSIYTARRAHALFGKEKNTLQQRSIIKQFGKHASSEKATHLVSNAFKRIYSEMGMISKRVKRVTLSDGESLFHKGDAIDYIYLIGEGELSIFDKEKSKPALSLTAGEGALVCAYNATPQYVKETNPLEKEVEYATKTQMYRGSKILVENQGTKTTKKTKMYRGQIVAEPEEYKNKQTSDTTYRGSLSSSNLKGVHRYASAAANSKCVLFKFTPQEIESELQKYEGLHELFLEESSVHFKFSKVATSKFFTSLPLDLRYMIAGAAKITVYNEGDIIKVEDTPNTLHLISDGHFQVYRENDTSDIDYLGRLNQGDMVGIEAILAEERFNFIYQAEQGCEVLELDAVILKDIMALSEKFKTLIRTSYAKMKVDLA